MTSHTYEVEIKSLLGTKEKAEDFKKRLHEVDPNTKLIASSSQLNHYFVDGNLQSLITLVGSYLTSDDRQKLNELSQKAKDFSLRTRLNNQEVILVLKISVGDDTSANGVKRIEFEASIPELSLEELDHLILKAGFRYQAKWSRDREEYQYKDTTVTIDRNAGYGYVAEFESVENDETKIHSAKEKLLALMKELGVEELPQDRLERMFQHYNEHWAEYYGTDKVFEIL